MKSINFNQVNLRKRSRAMAVFIMAGLCLFLNCVPALVQADPLPQSDIDALHGTWENWDLNSATSSCSSNATLTSVTLTGSDNEQKAFNFFVGQGLNTVQAAAVIGNLMDESHLDPTIIQGGGDSNNPAAAGGGGWGIAQWTPGAKITGIAQSLGVTGNITDLSTQLQIVWAEMTGTSPTGYTNLVKDLKQKTDLGSAVSFFQVNFEGGVAGSRQQLAADALQKYGGGNGTVLTSATNPAQPSTCAALTSANSPDCQSANGVAKILCDAKRYDTVSYSETGAAGHQGGAAWHKSCPTIGPSCILDCSGLVNIAVYDVFGTDLRENTNAEASDTQYWQHIPLSQVQPGDLVQPGEYHGGHVEIIDHVQGQTLYTFGAHTSGVPQPDQVSPTSFKAGPGDVYLHYIGPGASAASSSGVVL